MKSRSLFLSMRSCTVTKVAACVVTILLVIVISDSGAHARTQTHSDSDNPFSSEEEAPEECVSRYAAGSNERAACENYLAEVGFPAYPLANAVANLKTSLSVRWTVARRPLGEICGSEYTVPRSQTTSNLSSPAGIPSGGTELTAAEPQISFACDKDAQYSMFFFDAGKRAVNLTSGESYMGNQGFGFLHWAKINVPCGGSGFANVSAGEIYAPGVPGFAYYVTPATPELQPHFYNFYVFEQTRFGISPSAGAVETFTRQQLGATFDLAAFLASFGANLTSKAGPVAVASVELTVAKFSYVVLAGFYGPQAARDLLCRALDARPWFDAAREQGVADEILATGNVAVARPMAVTYSNTPYDYTNPCNNQAGQSLPGGTLALSAASSNTNYSTARTRGGSTGFSTPAVMWPCTAGESFTMALFDGGHRGSFGAGNGYMHWLVYNIPCGANNMSDVGSGTSWNANFTFFPPANPEIAAHNYGFYVFKENGPFVPSGKDSWRRVINLKEWVESYAASFTTNGPIARAWAWESVSIWTAIVLKQAGFGSLEEMACKNLGYTTTTTGSPLATTATGEVTTGAAASQTSSSSADGVPVGALVGTALGTCVLGFLLGGAAVIMWQKTRQAGHTQYSPLTTSSLLSDDEDA